MRKTCIVSILLTTMLAFAACNRTDPTPTATTAPPTKEEPTAESPASTATPAPVDPEAIRSSLTATLLRSLQITVPITSGIGIEGAIAFPLETEDDSVRWLAHTVGLRSFDPEQNHALAIYAPGGDEWQKLARVEMAFDDDADNPGFSPDYLGEGGVAQVQIEPEHLWIQVEGGVGAHSGVYGLYSFDGSTLVEQINGFSSSPGVGHVEDVNGDGLDEVLIDATDYYVFCYACGVRNILYDLWYWDGAQMAIVILQPLSADAPEQVTQFNENLLALVAAGLWQDAQAMLDEAMIFSYTEPALAWNLTYVRVNAEARQAEADGESAYPLLSKVFYGDYAGTVDLMAEIGADGLFIPETELIEGSVAEGSQEQLAEKLVEQATAAIAAQPELAAAYFVRGWGAYVREFDEAAAVEDVTMAAELDPENVLYAKSVEYLTE